jgi:uncharacterized protein YkwD
MSAPLEGGRQSRTGARAFVAAAATIGTVGFGIGWSPRAGGVEPSTLMQQRAASAARMTLSQALGEIDHYRSAVQVAARKVAEQKAATDAAAQAAAQAAAAQAAADAEAARQAAAAQAAAEEAARQQAAQEAAEEAAREEAHEAQQAARAASTTAEAPPAAPASSPLVAPSSQSAAEARFLSLINSARAGAGLSALQLDGRLQSAARSWAQQLSSDGSLHHQNVSAFLDTWMTAGENVAYGPSADTMFNALVNSPAHYENIMNSSFTVIGIGVVQGADGTLWTSHVFAG